MTDTRARKVEVSVGSMGAGSAAPLEGHEPGDDQTLLVVGLQ